MKVDAHSRVTLKFRIELTDGTEVDATKTPASLVMGDGSLPQPFEQLLYGMQAGQSKTRTIPARDAFGVGSPQNVRTLPRAHFKEMELEEGLIISFAAQDGELPGVVKEVSSELVKVDFNHPLAGQDIVFSVEVVQVEPVNSFAE